MGSCYSILILCCSHFMYTDKSSQWFNTVVFISELSFINQCWCATRDLQWSINHRLWTLLWNFYPLLSFPVRSFIEIIGIFLRKKMFWWILGQKSGIPKGICWRTTYRQDIIFIGIEAYIQMTDRPWRNVTHLLLGTLLLASQNKIHLRV